jgi:hypothetical protein
LTGCIPFCLLFISYLQKSPCSELSPHGSVPKLSAFMFDDSILFFPQRRTVFITLCEFYHGRRQWTYQWSLYYYHRVWHCASII